MWLLLGLDLLVFLRFLKCGMMKMKCHVIDALEEVGGQCTALYPEKPIYDIPGFPSINAGDLIVNLKKQADPFHPTYHLGDKVESVRKIDAPQEGYRWLVTTAKGVELQARIIIIAAGVGAFGPNKPPLDNIEEFEEKSVHYFVRWRETYKDKSIVIAGGGDSAIDWALSLSNIAKKVYVVHRRPKFRAAPDSVDKLHKLHEEGVIELVTPYQLSRLSGTNGQLEAVHVKDLEGQERALEADYLLPFFGLSTNLGPISQWGLNLDKSHIATNPSTAETSEEGIFAVGDVATYDNKIKLILCGFSEAAQAAHKARALVYPEEVFHFEYSTTSGVGL